MSAEFTSDITRAASCIRDGGVLICPSEGVYGISCSLFNEDAINRVIAIKERDVSKGLIVVDSSLDTLKNFLDDSRLNAQSKMIMQKMWPGPHTFVVPTNSTFDSIALRKNHTAAFRITSFDTLKELCTLSKCPIISTSANISGKNATSSIDALDKVLLERVDVVLSLPCQGLPGPTSIYDTLTNTLVRQGPEWNL